MQKNNIYKTLKKLNINRKDNVFIHSNLGLFLENKKDINKKCRLFFDTILKRIGKDGTLAVPTFTYSTAQKKTFNYNNFYSTCGIFSEYVKNHKKSKIYFDPNVSVAAVGKNSKFLTERIVENSYGEGSFFAKFINLNGKILNININCASTFIHFFEREFKVKYRFDKKFNGTVINDKNNKIKVSNKLYVIKKNIKKKAVFNKFCELAKKHRYVRSFELGRGFLTSISLRNTKKIVFNGLKKDKYFLIGKI